ncbi:unnamed protein product (macronuclear) [Paramecium tetraurelia]|uniref:Uncharacterized protein n=1 Tax=Paramecium tetraurelia TaxID=5888 RepID=A0CRU0_PARTE|nr:uncharacterized protein GSPATT00009822001 [Paramecium tetraurelia]CAK73507.1 unnamed protein product [Paramecium tetraurelia]|eukprot:XP_001440904.1 hypothetical protein (macronuclear) [Paramecium tetraurelia strain d4-2]
MKGSSQKNKILEQIQKQRRSQSRQNDSKINSLHFQGIQIQEFSKEIDDYLRTFSNLQQLGFQRCKLQSHKQSLRLQKYQFIEFRRKCFWRKEALNRQRIKSKISMKLSNQNNSTNQHTYFQRKILVCDDDNFTTKIWGSATKTQGPGMERTRKTEIYDDDEEDEEEDEEEIDEDDDDSFSISDDEEDEEYSEVEESESESNKKKKKVKK